MQSSPHQSQHHFSLSSKTGKWTIAATIIPSSMAFIDGTALNVILPSLQTELEANAIELFWILNSYLLMLASLIIVGGALGDRMGRVRVFALGIAVFTLGSLLCGWSQNVLQLILFRGIQGCGGALMIPGSLSIIAATFTPQEKGRAIGIWSAVTTVVTICGPILGGALGDLGLWRGIFFVNIPLGLATLLILKYLVPESKAAIDQKIDWVGALLLVLGLAIFTFGLLEIPEWSFTHPVVLISLLLGMGFFIAFVVFESKAPNAMVPFGIFSKSFSGVNLLSFFLYAALGGILLFLPLNLVQIQGYSQFQAGLTFLPFSLLMVSLASIAGRLTDKYGPRNFLIIGPTLTGVGFLLLTLVGLTDGPAQYWTTFFPGVVVFALGMSITVVPLTTAVMTSVDEDQAGIASGINNSVTRVASTFMNGVLGAMVVYLFVSYVRASIESMGITTAEASEIIEESRKLGDAKPPPTLSVDQQLLVKTLFNTAFINVYRIVGFLSAGLAFLSALIAVFMVEPKKE